MKNIIKVVGILALLVATIFAAGCTSTSTGYQPGDKVYRWVSLSGEVIPNSGITYVGKYHSGGRVYFTFEYKNKQYYTDAINGHDASVSIGRYGFTITDYYTGESQIRVGFHQL